MASVNTALAEGGMALPRDCQASIPVPFPIQPRLIPKGGRSSLLSLVRGGSFSSPLSLAPAGREGCEYLVTALHTACVGLTVWGEWLASWPLLKVLSLHEFSYDTTPVRRRRCTSLLPGGDESSGFLLSLLWHLSGRGGVGAIGGACDSICMARVKI